SQTHELVASIATNPQITQHTSTPRVIVERLLLRRLGEELRAVELLAERGHGYQDISSASNLFEQSHFLTFATADDTRATEFLNWSKPRQGMNSIKAIVNFSGLLRSWDTNRIEAEYDKYRFLCGFKHNNPMFMKFLQMPVDPDQYLARLALADSNWFVLTSV